MSIQKQPDPRDQRYFGFVIRRVHGLSEARIATDLGFDSPQHLYRLMSQDGYPVCPECGAAPVADTHCMPPVHKGRRWATRGGGEAQELPPPRAASHLFHEALRSLQRDVGKLSNRRERLKDGRFVAERVLSGERGEAWQTHRRGDLPEEAWREECEEYGADPSRDEFDEPVDSVQPVGIKQYPPEPLTRLIGMYVLSGYPVELLVGKLHPNPEAIGPETKLQLTRQIENEQVGLKRAARAVARLVRGGDLPRGRNTGELSPAEEDAMGYIEERRGEAASDEEILAELRAGYGFRQPKRFGVAGEGHAWPDITISDVRRLGKLA